MSARILTAAALMRARASPSVTDFRVTLIDTMTLASPSKRVEAPATSPRFAIDSQQQADAFRARNLKSFSAYQLPVFNLHFSLASCRASGMPQQGAAGSQRLAC